MSGSIGSSDDVFDVTIIGGGVVGAAIAREFSKYEASVALVEADADVGAGTSKANTAILHTGYDAKPGTLEARLVRRGWELFGELAPELGIPVERVGALLVAWTSEELAELDPIREQAVANGYEMTRRLKPAEVYELEPHLGEGALGGLEVPGESIVCTFTSPLAFATQAIANGVCLRLDSKVLGIAHRETGEHLLELTNSQRIMTRWLVNAAGLGSDEIDRMLGHERFTIAPRRGELIVFDKLARGLVNHILLPVPTKLGKGVLVAPTVYGNVVLGPSTEEIDDREATGSTAAGLEGLLAKGRRIMPALLEQEVTATYAGLRAATEHSDYQLFLEGAQRYVCVAGIRSTGLTASPAIAEHVVELVASAGDAFRPKSTFKPIRMPNIGEAGTRPYQDGVAIDKDARYGSVVCHCEYVTRGEVLDALQAPIPARTVDGLRRRTRALLGRCQGFYCLAEILELIAERTGSDVEHLLALPAESSRGSRNGAA